jgi:hypothetical protein
VGIRGKQRNQHRTLASSSTQAERKVRRHFFGVRLTLSAVEGQPDAALVICGGRPARRRQVLNRCFCSWRIRSEILSTKYPPPPPFFVCVANTALQVPVFSEVWQGKKLQTQFADLWQIQELVKKGAACAWNIETDRTQWVYPPPVFFANSAESHEKKRHMILQSAKECARI